MARGPAGAKRRRPRSAARWPRSKDGGTIPVWGDGTAVRSYTYVDDMVDGIYRLMHSDLEGPVNIGNPEYVTVKELVETVAAVSGKRVNVEWVKGPVGVQSRNFSNERIYSHRLARTLLHCWRGSGAPIRGSRRRYGRGSRSHRPTTFPACWGVVSTSRARSPRPYNKILI